MHHTLNVGTYVLMHRYTWRECALCQKGGGVFLESGACCTKMDTGKLLSMAGVCITYKLLALDHLSVVGASVVAFPNMDGKGRVHSNKYVADTGLKCAYR